MGDKYTLTARPHPDVPPDKHASNLFLESVQGLPMVGTMQHEKPRSGYRCDSCWIKGCCLTYRIDGDEAEVCENIVPSDFCEMFVFEISAYHSTLPCHLHGMLILKSYKNTLNLCGSTWINVHLQASRMEKINVCLRSIHSLNRYKMCYVFMHMYELW